MADEGSPIRKVLVAQDRRETVVERQPREVRVLAERRVAFVIADPEERD